uniref:PH domain-containing protein n=1 Tax=Cyprinus carpio TaxID=7962 RepID=A0A8C1QF35_CYPCA
MVSAHVEQCLQRCAELAVDVLEIESEMAVRCEPDRCGLDDLQEYQDQLEAEYRVLKEEVEAMVSLASCLSDVCPERMNAVGTEIQTSLNAWDELGKSVAENKKRLLQFGHLRHFFRNYLAMISWTEDTRSCIFSESALRQSRENQEPLVEVLDRQIEQKFEEFDQLAVAGKKLFDDEHHLNKMIRERVEELRSMLGWILVHWRAQKDQLLSRQKTEEAQTDAIYSEAMVCRPQTQLETSPEVSQKKTESLTSAPPGDTEDGLQHSYGYEVMQSVSPKGSDDSSRLERPDSPYLVLKEPSPSALGGTVNLILSFSNSGDTQIQVQAPGREGGVPVSEPVHRPAESHSSACKSFWKRCQGLFGSLKRKTKIYQHSAEEVSTYLHVTENNTAVYESMALPQDKAPRPSSSSPRTLYALSSPCTSPYSSSSIKDTLQQANNLLPKNGNISIFSSLKRKSKKARKKKDDRRHTIQKVMGEDLSEQDDLPPVREPVTYDTHTWPLKERKKRKNARKPKSDGTQVLDYIKNPLVKDIDAECSGEVGSPVHSTLEVATQGHVKNHCRFLSLGSVLSFDLPKDMSLIPSIQDVITIGPPEQKKTDSHHQDTQVDRPTALSTFKTVRSCPMQKEEPKQIYPGELTLKIECKDSKKISIDTVSFTEDEFPPPPSPVVEDISFEENHPSSVSNLTNIQQKHLSGISIVPKEEMVSWKANGTQLENKENHYVSVPEDAIQGVALTMAEIHVCPSDHTLVHNLNGHVFHRPVKNSSTQQLSPSHASHVVLNFRANGREDSVDSGHSSSGSFKLCAEGPYIDSSDCPVPKRTTGKVPSLDAGVSTKNFEFSKDKNITLSFDIDAPVHPDHQQFEQEEEELEDIWNHTNSHRESLNSDIMYNGYQATSSLDQHREPSPKEQAVLFRKLVTASAPNLLVAEFRLPPSVQTMVGSGKQQNPREERQILDKGDRRSWAAFTQQEQVYKQVSLNETASDMVKLPEIQDQQKYIYHYREEEEEEEGEEKETGFLKDQSMSLLSVHMGLDWTSDNVIQSGRQELELPSMEGTLERKQKLQLGGKKASCRAWNSYHAVLYKQTICFYQDRKDTLKSCMTSLPLNLIGAVCEPSPEYTKKPNCFCLRLRDGSEYLLSASSRFMMKKWILRIQAHTASSDSVVNRSTCHGSSASAALPRHSPAITGCQCGDKCHCSMRNYVTSTVLAQSQPASGRTKEIIVHTSDALQIHQRHQDLLLPSFSDAGHCEDEFDSHGESLRQKPSSVSTVQGWTSEKRRSHSFTSATYQRIKPVAPPSGKGQDSSSSYSVTLFIGDREMPSVSKSTATASSNCARQESFSDLPMRSYMSLPRPPNKSVFRKFFGKKE